MSARNPDVRIRQGEGHRCGHRRCAVPCPLPARNAASRNTSDADDRPVTFSGTITAQSMEPTAARATRSSPPRSTVPPGPVVGDVGRSTRTPAIWWPARRAKDTGPSGDRRRGRRDQVLRQTGAAPVTGRPSTRTLVRTRRASSVVARCPAAATGKPVRSRGPRLRDGGDPPLRRLHATPVPTRSGPLCHEPLGADRASRGVVEFRDRLAKARLRPGRLTVLWLDCTERGMARASAPQRSGRLSGAPGQRLYEVLVGRLMPRVSMTATSLRSKATATACRPDRRR